MLLVTDYIKAALNLKNLEIVKKQSPTRFEDKATRAPIVVWNVCQHCNMHCPHCYAAAVAKKSPEDLTTQEGKTLLANLYQQGIRVVIFSGGEPLLRADLLELIHEATALGLTAHLSTNGVFITESKAQELREAGVHYVGISLDGLQEYNDHYRGLAHGFEKAVSGLKAAKAAGMKTGVRMTLTQKNASQLFDMIHFVNSLQVDRFYVSHLMYSGRGAAIEDDDLSPTQTRKHLLSLFEKAYQMILDHQPLNMVTGSNDSDGPLLLNWIRQKLGESPAALVADLLKARGGNSAGEGLINIDHKGDVHPDQFWRQMILGNAKTQALGDILKNPFCDLLRKREELLTGRCGACFYKSLCRGSHRERALAVYGDIWAPDPSCVMTDDEIQTL